jgi:uncharacterized protein YkwD
MGSATAEAAVAPQTISATDALENQVLVELNAIRRAHGLRALRLAPSLGAAADFHSQTMGRYGFFAHESRDGSAFHERVKRFYTPAGYGSWSVGENLLWGTHVNATGALKSWMASPGHRKNILTARWREIGVSIVAVERAPGVFGNRDVTIITTEFGVRS